MHARTTTGCTRQGAKVRPAFCDAGRSLRRALQVNPSVGQSSWHGEYGVAEFFALNVDGWRTFVRGLTTGPDTLRLLLWSQALGALREARWPQQLGGSGKFSWNQRLLTDGELALMSPDVLPNVADPRLARAWRRIVLGTARHSLFTGEPGLSATLGITIPDAGLFRDSSDNAQWRLLVDTLVYPQASPPADLAFLANRDAHWGLASPDIVADILERDRGTDLFRRVAAYYCGEGGEFSVIHRFLELVRVEKLWLYVNAT